MTYETPQERLEQMIDAQGIAVILEHLAAICYGKAEHLRVNWQDQATARAWDKVGKQIDSITVGEL